MHKASLIFSAETGRKNLALVAKLHSLNLGEYDVRHICNHITKCLVQNTFLAADSQPLVAHAGSQLGHNRLRLNHDNLRFLYGSTTYCDF